MAFAAVFGGESLATDQGALFTHQSLELATVASVKTSFSAFTSSFELALAFAILVELARRGSGELRSGYSRRRLNERERQKCEAGCCVTTV